MNVLLWVFTISFNEFALESEFNYLGIRFLPGMFPVAFAIEASELSNCMLLLKDIQPGAARYFRDDANPQCWK